MLLHKDESARDTTLFRHFLTKMTSLTTLVHALTGVPDFPFGSNSRIASYSPPHCLAPPDSSLNKPRNITYSSQSFSHGDILSPFVQFVNRFIKKEGKRLLIYLHKTYLFPAYAENKRSFTLFFNIAKIRSINFYLACQTGQALFTFGVNYFVLLCAPRLFS